MEANLESAPYLLGRCLLTEIGDDDDDDDDDDPASSTVVWACANRRLGLSRSEDPVVDDNEEVQVDVP
jgi:hypothetical protein